MNMIRTVFIASVLFLAVCGEENDNQEGVTSEVEGIHVSVRFENNPTAEALRARLPLTLLMQDLHQNEKYFYFDEPLPSNPERVGLIRAGDVTLYGDDCLVLFYEDVETSYAYTRIGWVENLSSIHSRLGNRDIMIHVK